jgi:hypothetical protein
MITNLDPESLRRVSDAVHKIESMYEHPLGEEEVASYAPNTTYAIITSDTGGGVYYATEVVPHSTTAADHAPKFASDGLANRVVRVRELNATSGIPINTIIEVRSVPVSEFTSGSGDYSDGPFEWEWVFTAGSEGYGVDDGGAWVEITGDVASPYSWKQLDADASTDTVPAVTGTYNLYEVNGFDGYLKEMVVWARHDGTNYQFSHHHSSFWAKLTGESSGSYSWTELQTNGSTATTRTGTTNAQEVSGRLGIPDNSIVRMFQGRGPANYRFEYHGANSGTLDILSEGTIGSPSSDAWDRETQSTKRGVEVDVVCDVRVDSGTGEIYKIRRRHEADANGHEEHWDGETETLIGVGTPSTETYEFVDCATGLVTVARYEFADLPDDDYCYVHNGSCYVKSYNDGISAGAATSPVPCAMYMPSTPANCSAVNVSAFDEDFNATLDTPCHWSSVGTGTYTGGYLEFDDSTSGQTVVMVPPCLEGQFTLTLDFEAAFPTTDTGSLTRACDITIFIGGQRYDLVSARNELSTGSGGVYVNKSGVGSLYSDTTSYLSGTFTITRNGSDLVSFKKGGTTLVTETKAGDVTYLSISSLTNETTYTGMYLRLKDLSFSEP